MPFDAPAFRGFLNNLSIASLQLPADAAVAAMVRVAKGERDRVISEAVSRSGIAPHYRQIVDGVLGAPLESVKPTGEIVFNWSYLPEVVSLVVQALIARAPMLKGTYRNSIIVMIDGIEAEPGTELDSIDITTKEVTIVPTVPYARRLEVGKRHDGSPFVLQVKPHIVEETSIVVRRLYGQFVNVQFNYVDFSGAFVLSESGRIARHFVNGRWRSDQSPRKRHGRVEANVRYPAIVLDPRIA
jgi:hypothetical protein